MKNRSVYRRGEVEMVASRGSKSNFKRKMKNKQRLGGEGLSLHAFANAKSNNSYNPNLIKKQREMYKNAKIVKKFKKSLKQQNQMESSLPTTSMVRAEDPGMDVNEQHTKAKKKKKDGLQSLREEYEQRREEKEKARKEREAMIQAKEEEKARAESKRKTLRQTMFKKTRSGQPVMKYRIEHLLKGIKEDQHL